MNRRIVLSFEHTACGTDVEIYVPLPDPLQEGAQAIADHRRPACPICKALMQYVGFSFDDTKED